MQAYNKTMYAYGDEAPCYSSPRMLEEALGVDLRWELFSNYVTLKFKRKVFIFHVFQV